MKTHNLKKERFHYSFQNYFLMFVFSVDFHNLSRHSLDVCQCLKSAELASQRQYHFTWNFKLRVVSTKRFC